MFELTGVDGYEREHGRTATGELLRRLAERLTDAVAGAGVAYRIGHTRFAVLVRVGRGGSQAIVLACAAALAEGHNGAGIDAKPSTVIVPIELVNPADALLLLERVAADAGGQVAGSLPGQASLHTATGSFMEDRARAPARAYSGPSEPVRTDTATASAAMGAVTAGSAGSALRERPRGGRRHYLTDHARVAPAPGDRKGPGPRTIADARRRVPPTSHQPPGRLPYMRISTRFKLSVLFGMLWMGLSAWLASPWITQLANSITLPGAIALIAGLALIPGYLNAQLMASLLLDHPKRIDPHLEFAYPALTVIVAAYDEQRKIAQTLAYALEQDYPGELNVILVDDGSHDETANIAWSFVRLDERLQVLQVAHGGKAAALNAGLRAASTSLVATIDADTLLMPGALRRIVARMLWSPSDTVAVAGSVMVRNSRRSIVSAAQTWDYFLGIGSIKRQQALLQATLVAQGAFSVYDAAALRAVGGWPDCIGEDIVMTWALLDQGGRTTYEPTAVAFTEAPVTLRRLARQRRRWARGMIEGLRAYGAALIRRHKTFAHSVIADATFPYLDFVFTFAFIPGIALAITGNFAIVGPMTLAVLPLNALLASVMYHRQRRSLMEAGLQVRRATVGFAFFFLLYQIFMSPVSVSGYFQEVFHVGRRW